MALYYHFANKDEVLDGIVDLVFAEIDLPVAGRRLEDRDAAAGDLGPRRPGSPSLGDRPDGGAANPGPANLRHHDAVIGNLRAAGFDMRDGRPRVLGPGRLHLRLRADQDEPAVRDPEDMVAEMAQTHARAVPVRRVSRTSPRSSPSTSCSPATTSATSSSTGSTSSSTASSGRALLPEVDLRSPGRLKVSLSSVMWEMSWAKPRWRTVPRVRAHVRFPVRAATPRRASPGSSGPGRPRRSGRSRSRAWTSVSALARARGRRRRGSRSPVRVPRRLRARLAGEIAEPEDPLAGEMADGRPERPAVWRGLIASAPRSSPRRHRGAVGWLCQAGKADPIVVTAVPTGHATSSSPLPSVRVSSSEPWRRVTWFGHIGTGGGS